MAVRDDLRWLPAWRIRQLVAAREVSPVEVVEQCIERIEALDPAFHAFRMTDHAAARRQAQAAEKAVLRGDEIGPMHGVPICVKEHIPVAGLQWHDLKTYDRSIAKRDGAEAERLRRAGAIIVGVTVAGLTATEFGASDRQPLNAWNRNRICGDSSSGSACAVAAGLTPVAVAVDGLGSTRLPAAYSGLVGLLATRGRIPMFTWNELSTRLLASSGPLARDVRDAALLFSVLAGPDPRDFGALPDPAPDVLSGLDGGVKGMRLLWTDDFGYGAGFAAAESAELIAAVRTAAEALRGAGATIEPMGQAFEDPTRWCNAALASDHAMFSYAKLPDDDIAQARQTRGDVARGLQAKLQEADFILSPTAQQIAPTLAEWSASWAKSADGKPANHMPTYTAFTGFMNLIGWPALSIPAGLVRGMPVALQIIGKPNSEPGMFRLAQAFARLTDMGLPSDR
jgi:Asp-tRNA(Asn)/Glu-tRNA(Gln) amidotransferase A subunit family amidase